MRLALACCLGLVLHTQPLLADEPVAPPKTANPPSAAPAPSGDTAKSWEEYGVDELMTEEKQPKNATEETPPVDVRRGLLWAGGTTAAAVVGWLIFSHIFQCVGMVPVVGQLMSLASMVWPVVASAAGWWVGTPRIGKRVALVPTMLVGGIAQIAARVACMPLVMVCSFTPLGCVVVTADGLLQALVNGAATALMLSKTGRPLYPGEAARNWDFFSVPDPPPLPEDKPRVKKGIAPPVVTPPVETVKPKPEPVAPPESKPVTGVEPF